MKLPFGDSVEDVGFTVGSNVGHVVEKPWTMMLLVVGSAVGFIVICAWVGTFVGDSEGSNVGIGVVVEEKHSSHSEHIIMAHITLQGCEPNLHHGTQSQWNHLEIFGGMILTLKLYNHFQATQKYDRKESETLHCS